MSTAHAGVNYYIRPFGNSILTENKFEYCKIYQKYIKSNFRTFCTECGHFTAPSALSAAHKGGCPLKLTCTMGTERKRPRKLKLGDN